MNFDPSALANHGILGILLALFLVAAYKAGTKLVNHFLKERAEQHKEEIKLRDDNFDLIIKDNQKGFESINQTLNANAEAEKEREEIKNAKRGEFSKKILDQLEEYTRSMDERFADLHDLAVGHERDIKGMKEDHEELKKEVRRNRVDIDEMKNKP